MVDAVILWVDGSDPAFQEKKAKYLPSSREGLVRNATSSTRFADDNEIFYCIHSIRKFAPWIDKIHLVTDDQIPHWLDSDERVRLGVHMISHRVLFADQHDSLPVFTARSLESLLIGMPELSDNFLCFNDDFFLVNKVNKEHFFKIHAPNTRD